MGLVVLQHMGYSQIRDRPHVSCITSGFFTTDQPAKPHITFLVIIDYISVLSSLIPVS